MKKGAIAPFLFIMFYKLQLVLPIQIPNGK